MKKNIQTIRRNKVFQDLHIKTDLECIGHRRYHFTLFSILFGIMGIGNLLLTSTSLSNFKILNRKFATTIVAVVVRNWTRVPVSL